MNVYKRYFRIKTGKLIVAVNNAEKTNKDARKSYKEILTEIGADTQYYQIKHKLHSFVFKENPDQKIYKRKGEGWYPKKNNKAGKIIAAKIESVVTVAPQDLLEIVGLQPNPTIFAHGKCYWPNLTVIPESQPIVYITVPWYDENPDKIEQYKKDNAKGIHGSQNLESLMWMPTKEMEEVKSWEVDKHIDEWNSKIKEK